MNTEKDVMNGELLPEVEDRMLTDSTLIKVGEMYYETRTFHPTHFKIGNTEPGDDLSMAFFKLEDGLKLDKDIAYLIGDYFYFYRGELPDGKMEEELEVGIYHDLEKDSYLIRYPYK